MVVPLADCLQATSALQFPIDKKREATGSESTPYQWHNLEFPIERQDPCFSTARTSDSGTSENVLTAPARIGRTNLKLPETDFLSNRMREHSRATLQAFL